MPRKVFVLVTASLFVLGFWLLISNLQAITWQLAPGFALTIVSADYLMQGLVPRDNYAKMRDGSATGIVVAIFIPVHTWLFPDLSGLPHYITFLVLVAVMVFAIGRLSKFFEDTILFSIPLRV